MSIEEQVRRAKFRAVLRSKSDGAEFPVFLEHEDEATEAAEFLKAEVVSVTSATPATFSFDMLMAMARGDNIINRG
jgi:hypothetical protein